MNIIIGAISIFGLGYAANELTNIPTPAIFAVCFLAIIATLVISGKKWKRGAK